MDPQNAIGDVWFVGIGQVRYENYEIPLSPRCGKYFVRIVILLD